MLPEWARGEATVRCFAAPDHHRHDDQRPSCSVNLSHGAWRCHGCGAAGGAFDAATVLGHAERTAVDLMVAHGLTARRASRRRGAPIGPAARLRPVAPDRRAERITVSEAAFAEWQAALVSEAGVTARLARERGWQPETIRELGLGLYRGRITIPVRDEFRRLVGLLHYQPWPTRGEPKMYAARGSRRQPLPHPAAETSRRLLLVEGEADMIAARSHGLTAIALPGVRSWQPRWAKLLAGRRVVIVMDADTPVLTYTNATLSDSSILVAFGHDGEGFTGEDPEAVERALDVLLPGMKVRATASHNRRGERFTGQTWGTLRPGQWTQLRELAHLRGPLFLAGSDVAAGWAGPMEGALERRDVTGAPRARFPHRVAQAQSVSH